MSTEESLRRLVAIFKYPSQNVHEYLDYALQQVIELTRSHVGYVFHYNEEKREFSMNNWTKAAMDQCAILEPDTRYLLDNTGIWGDAVRNRSTVVVNDYSLPNPHKRGYPSGHVAITRFMSIPVFKGERIVGVIGLANKEEPYDEEDVQQAALLIDAVWQVTDRINAEAQIKRLLEEKQTILHEVHHRMKNNMAAIDSILSLQGSMAKSPEVSEALKEAARRVKVMMYLYRQLFQNPDDSGALPISTYLSALLKEIEKVFYGRSVVINATLCDDRLDPKRLQDLGIIINELITNAYKYAFPRGVLGTIEVAVERKDDYFIVTVRDNGIGLSEANADLESSGFGFTLVREMTRHLGGTIKDEGGPGTRIRIELPVSTQRVS